MRGGRLLASAGVGLNLRIETAGSGRRWRGCGEREVPIRLRSGQALHFASLRSGRRGAGVRTPAHSAFLSGIRKPPEKLSPLLQQGAPRGSLASAGEGRGEASRCTALILRVSGSHVMSCSDRNTGTFGPSVRSERNIRILRTYANGRVAGWRRARMPNLSTLSRNRQTASAHRRCRRGALWDR
jgi:hypothetical protein